MGYLPSKNFNKTQNKGIFIKHQDSAGEIKKYPGRIRETQDLKIYYKVPLRIYLGATTLRRK